MMVVPAFLRRRLPSLLVVAASAFLTNCSLDELLSPSALGTITVEAVELVDTARVGSTAPRSTTVPIGIAGTIPTLKFAVTAELGSPWITAGLGVGTAPNDLTITLDPSGLAVGEYSDTLRFTNDGPDARLIRVPVKLTILPCAVTDLAALPASVSETLTAEDCAATGTTDRFAKRFRFTGTAGDSISVRVGPAAFTPRVTLRREGVATPLGTSESCTIVGDGACVRYIRLLESGAYEVEVTSASAGVTGTFELNVTRPRAPSAPTTLSQRSATDLTAVIAAGSTIGTDRIALQAAIADADSDSLRLEIELRPLATPFSNVATSTTALTRNPTVANTVTGLLDNTQYHWQARTIDQTGRASAWVAFGGGVTADFAIGVAEAPNAPTLLVQRRADGVTPIAIGATTNEPIIRLGATVSDPDPADQIRLEFEVRTLGTPFTNVATQSSAAVASGTAVLTSVAGLVDNGQYRWQARAVDQSGRASAWVSLGGTGAHFRTAIPPAQVVFTQEPTNANAGAAITPAVRVAVQDASGNTLASYTGPVTIALGNNTAGATLSGTTTVSAVAGVASFTDLSLDKVATGYTLVATVGALNRTSAPFAITSSAADRMELGAVPTTIVAGTTFSPALQVTVRDALGNVATGFTGNITLALSPNDSGAVLLGTTTVAAVAGVATFSDLRIERAANNLTLLVTAAGLANVTSAPLSVTAAAPASLRIVVAPSANAASGVPFAQQPAVELDDSFGNLVLTAGTTVSATLASGPTGASLVSASATTNASGRATFSGLAILGASGSYTLTFASGALTSAPTGTITIGAGVATQLSLRTAPPATAVNGEPLSIAPRVRLRDAAENNVFTSGVPVTVSIATGGGTLLGTTTVLTNTTGEATFSDLGILGTVGDRTLAFSAPSVSGVTTGIITLTPGAATTLALNAGDGQTGTAAANVAIAPSVVARDISGNAVSGVAVSFAVTSGGGSISPVTPVTTGANGVAALTSWTLGAAVGVNTLSASAGDLDGSPVTFTATATAGAASQIVITGGDNLTGPVGTSLATPHEVRITDATGNPVAGVTVNWSAVGGGSVAPLTTVTDADGRASATRTLGPTAGSFTTVASATLVGGPASVTFNVTATVGGATQLALVTGDAQVDTVGATLPVPLTVVVRDALNNPVPGVLISWSVLAGGGSVSPASAPTNASGIATTNWTLGTVRTATDSTQIARASGVGSPVTFVALARAGAVSATQTTVVVAPTSVAASRTTPATVTVTARDGFGNPVAGVPVTLSATGAGNTIVQPIALTNASGVATGSIGATVTGARTISATVNGVLATATPTLNVVAAPATALLFTVSPENGVAGEDLTPAPAVGVVDSLGNRNLTFTGTVTLGIASNPSTGVLSGSTSRTAVAGVATFPGVAIDKAGAGYTLSATSTGLGAATSGAFALTAGGVDVTQSSIGASPLSIVAGSGTSTITVIARDANGNVVPGATVVLAATGSGNTLTQPLGVTDANGVATGSLSATVIGTRTVSARINDLDVPSTVSVTVVPAAISPTLSTITGIPTTLVAGVEVSAVTVSARDLLGNPVAGATVVIAATGSNNTIVQPLSVTNASGIATGSFGSTVAESKTLSATINGVALSSAVTVAVTPGAISAARSLVAAAPGSIVAGEGTSTITVTARDANDNLITGASVVLAATGAGNTLTQPAGPTNASGVATGALSSVAIGSKTVTATIGGIAITQSAVVTVTAGGVSTTQSTIESDSATVAAGDTVTLTVTARDASGNPVSGVPVVIAATGTGNTIAQPASVTDALGVATGRLVSTVAESKTISATVNGLGVAQSVVVDVTPAAISDTASSVVVDPTTLAADGSSASVTVTVRDRFANVVSGAAVVLAATGTGNTLTQPASVTDANGVATGSISSTAAGLKSISATAEGIALADTVTLTVTPAGISAAQSTVSIDPTALVAGSGSSVITVTARDGNGNVVPGATVVLAATGAGNTLTQPTLVTDANGVATGSISSTGAGSKTISATINGVAVTQTAVLSVTAAAISATTSTLATSTTTVAAGAGSSTLTVTARDAFGNAVAGATVVLSATGDGNTLTQPAAVTNAAGVATGSFTSTTSEAKTISATAGGVTLAQTVVITVVPDAASPTTSTVVASATNLIAGADTATVTVTARDGSGNIVPGVTVVLESASADLILLQPASVTDANGVATGRVVGTLVGSKVVSAKLNGVNATATVSFTVLPAAISADSSTIAADATSLTAGAVTTPVVVTARDAFGNAISGATVVLAAAGTNNTVTQPSAVTDVDGRATGAFASTEIGPKILSATVNGVSLIATDTVTIVPAAVNGAQSTISLSAASITAGGAASTITVTARDIFGNVISGATVVLEATGTSNTLVQPAAVTNALGVATGTFASTIAGARTISASINGTAVSATPLLTVNAAAVSATLSTIGSDPSSIVAGSGTSTITVRARDQFGNNVPGATVSLLASGSSNTLVQPLDVTDSEGFATGTLSSSVAESKSITAIVNGVTLASGLTITVTPGAVSAANTMISASPATLTAGAGSSTITVTARDANNNVVPGATVVLASSGATGTLTQPADVTSGAGVATGSFSATLVGVRTISATVNGVAITATTTVTVSAAAISAAQSTVSVLPTSIVAGGAGTTAIITVRDAFDNPISGATVVVASTGTGNSITQPIAVTDANGVATATVATTVVEAKTISATANGIALTQTAALTVTPGAVSAALSTVSASAASIVAGSGTSTITVTARDANGNVIPNAAVSLVATGSGNTITPSSGTTDAAGVFTASFSATAGGLRSISATIDAVAITQTAAVTVTSSGISAAQSLVSVTPGTLIAGQDTATVTITVRDEFNNPISGVSVSLAASGANNGIVQPAVVTDANGVTTGRVTSTTAELKTITATAGATVVTQTASVSVTPAAVSAAQSTVSALPLTLTAGTTDSSAVTVTARDAFGNLISGATVVLGVTGGSGNTVVQPTAVTDANGVATGYVRSTGAGAKTISATIAGTLVTQTASVTVGAAGISIATSSIAVGSATISAGVGVTSVTVTVRDAFSNPIAGATVVLASTGTDNTITQPVGVTNALGVATGSFRSTNSELKTLSATANGLGITQTVNVNVVPDAASASESLISASVASIVAGAETSTITVTARDVNGNPVPGVSVTLEASPVDVDITQPVAVTDANGQTTGVVSGTVTGTYTITALLNGVPATNTVDVTVTPAAPSTTLTTASATPTTISAGSGTSDLSVTVRDAFGNLVPNATVEWSATGTGNSITSSASTNASGVATGTFSSTVVGAKIITVTLSTGDLPSALTVTVQPGAAFAGKSTVATSATNITTDGSATITVQLRDENENLLTSSSGTVTLATTLGTLSAVTAVGNGTYTATLTSTAIGTATVSGQLNGQALENTVDVQVAIGAASVAQSQITAAPTSMTTDGSSTITVQIRDATTNNFTTSAGTVTLATTLGVLTAVTDNGNGTYTATLTSGATGTATITGTLNGVAITDNAVVTVGIGAPSLTLSTVSAANATRTTDEVTTITVQLRDGAGNNLTTSGGTVTLQVTGGSLTAVTNNNNGTYTATLSSTTVGNAVVTARLNGDLLTDDATVAFTVGAASLATSTITANDNAITTDESATITVQLRDAGGNSLTASTATVTLATTRGVLSAVTNNNNGTYTATLTSTSIGDATITGTLNGNAIADTELVSISVGAPATLAFTTQPSASSVAGIAFAQQPVVTIRDAAGNTVTTSTASVSLALTTGSGTLSGTTSVNAVAGVATFSGLSINVAGTDKVLTASSGALPTVASNVFTITAGGATQIALNAGNAQTVVAGTAVPIAPSVLVRDANNNPVSGVAVTFAVASGNGGVTGGSALTNASGIATVGSWTLGTTAGANSLTATAAGLTGSPVTFTATGTAGAATQIAINDGNGQTAIAGANVAVAPSVIVRDVNGNAVSGVSVTFAVASGNGGITGAVTSTNASGIATVGSWTLGTLAGSNTLSATSTGLAGSPLTFTATGTAGAAAQISINAGNGQTATAGSNVAVAPSVLVVDANGNPVSGVAVTFAIASGNGSLTGAATTTNASGIATVGSWTLGAAAGANSITATSGTLTGSPVTFTATGIAGAASQIAINAGNAQSAVAGTAVTIAPSVIVRDANNNPVSGVAVTFALGSGGGGLTGASTTTDASGIATVGSWTLGTTAGANSITATSGTLVGSPVTFTATGIAGAATQITINAGNAQTAVAGANVAIAPSVLVRDANGNAVSGVAVTFAIASGGGSVSGGSTTTDTNGIATVGSWTLGAAAGANSLTATSTGLVGSPVTFTATGTAGGATQMSLVAGDGEIAVAGTAVATPPSVLVRDANGNPVSGVAVTFAVASGNGSLTGENATSNASGIATVGSWTLGTTAGGNTVTASSTGLLGSPITFSALGVAGAAAQIAIDAGNAQSATVGTAVATAPSVIVTDSNGNPVSGVSVTFALISGGGSITGENATTNASGIATLGSWTLGTTAGPNSISATSGTLTGSPITFTATGTAGAATTIVLSAGDAQTATVGNAVSVAPAVLVRDANNNPVAGVAVTFAVTAGGGSVVGGAATTNASGIAAVTSWTLGSTAGPNTLSATAAGLTGSPVVFSATGTASAATQIALNAGDAQTATVGTAVAIAPSVVVRDASNNPVSGVTVTFAIASGNGSLTGASATTNASGIATVGSWTLGTIAGANSITATSGTLAGSPVTFTATGVAGAATQLAFTTQPSASTTAGIAFAQQPVVTIRDAQGNTVTDATDAVTLTLSTGSGALSGTATVNAIAGVATFSGLSINLIGADKVLTASSGSLDSSASNAFTITAAAASQIAVSAGDGQSATVGTAVPVAPSVIVRDAFTNPVSGVEVVFAVASGGGSALGTTVNTNASGIATVGSWTLGAAAGANSLTATSTGLSGSPVTFTATGTAGAATQLVFTTQPSASTVAGTAFAQQPVVTIRDNNGNTVTTATNEVTLALTTGSGTLSGVTTVNAVNGVATFSGLSINLVGNDKVLTASATGLTPAASNTFAITVGTATLITANGGDNQSATVATAVATPPSVLVRDANNNPVSGVSVTFAVASGGGSVTGENATTDANGIATVGSWTIGGTVGANTLTATSAGLTGSPVTFNATGTVGTPAVLAFTTQPSASTVAGTAFAQQPVVTIRDAQGNTVTTATNEVTLTLTTGSGTLSGTTAVNAVNGVATFSGLSINLIGADKQLSASAAGLTGATSNVFAIVAGNATQIAVNAGDGQTATAGSAVSTAPSVIVRDANNNPVSGVEVVFAVATGGGSALGTTVNTNASGIATVGSWTLGTTVGSNTLSATSGSLNGSPVIFTATGVAGAASQLAFTTQPSASTVAGTAFAQQPVITIRDANGNTVTTATNEVTLALSVGTGTLSGTLAVNAVNGVATFSGLSINLIGTDKVLSASATGLTGATSNTFTITAGNASQISLNNGDGQTAIAGSAVPIAPSVLVTDANNNPVSGVGVTFAIASGGGSLTGENATTNASGIATVGSWTLGATAGANSITATSGSLAGSPITFNATGTAGAAAVLAFTTQPSASSVAGAAFLQQPVVTIRDSNGNTVTTATNEVTLALAAGDGTLSGTLAVNAVNGVAAFSGLSIDVAGADKQLSATATGLTGATSNVFAITPAAASLANSAVSVGLGAINADATTTVTVQLIDAFGNALTSSGSNVVALTTDFGSITGLTNEGDGTWSATFVAEEAVLSTITATLNGDPIVDDAQVNVTAGAVSAATSTVTVSASPIAASSGTATSIITVTARDADSNPVPSANVVLNASGPGNTLTQPAVSTDASGQTTGTLSSTAAGSKTITATANGVAITDDATVVVEATTPSPANIQITVNDANITADETATITVQLIDQFGNLRTSNEGAIALNTNIGSITGLTDNSNGTWTATFNGIQAGTATITGNWSGNPIADNATVTVTAGAATQISINDGDGQSATVGTAVPIDPSVLVRDAEGNPVAGVTVTFTVTGGLGSVSGETPVSDANGIATVGSWTLGIIVGPNELTATSGSLTNSPLIFTATGTVGLSTQLVFSGPLTNTTVNATIPTFTVEARDQYGNLSTDFNNADVTVSIQSGSGAIAGTVTKKSASGITTYDNISANTVQNGLVLQAIFPGLTTAVSAPFNITTP